MLSMHENNVCLGGDNLIRLLPAFSFALELIYYHLMTAIVFPSIFNTWGHEKIITGCEP